MSSVHNYFSDGEKEKVIEVEIHKLVERQQSNSRPFCFTAPSSSFPSFLLLLQQQIPCNNESNLYHEVQCNSMPSSSNNNNNNNKRVQTTQLLRAARVTV